MSPLRCVICGGSDLLELCRWDPSISTDRRVLPVPTSTQVCRDCGATFNGGGARDQELSFYAEQYDLHGESAASEWQIYVDGSRRGETDAILEFVEQHVALGARGRLLEVGCGKGVFLGKFLQAHPEWSGFGIEPSANAVSYFEQILPTVEIHEGPFETAAFRKETFELVATSGVLEHVPDPVSFMEGVRGCMATGSRAFVGVPNFEAKPDDLLLFDHLTQFTPDSLDILYARVGLRRVGRSASPDRVWLWDMVEVGDSTPAPPAEHATRGLQLAESHQSRVRDGLSSFDRFLRELKPDDVGALFGLGVLGLYALAQAKTAGRSEIARIRYALDDNQHLWGGSKAGLEIQGSASANQLGITRCFLSANPCYHKRMTDKLVSFGLERSRIHGWGLP